MIMTQTTVLQHDHDTFCAYYMDKAQYRRYHHTIEAYAKRRKFKTVVHIINDTFITKDIEQ